MAACLVATSAAALLLLAAGVGATTAGCGSVNTLQVAIDCIGVAAGGCDAGCKAGLDAIKAQGSACESNFKAEPGNEDYDAWVQACYNPTTDQCVESAKGQAFVDCLDADVAQGYCPEKCKAAIAVTGLAGDARCRELVKSYVDGDLGGDFEGTLQTCGFSSTGSSTDSTGAPGSPSGPDTGATASDSGASGSGTSAAPAKHPAGLLLVAIAALMADALLS